MIDLNTLISNALTAAITNAVAPLNERIATLELQRGEMQRTIVTYSERIAALENNPAQGVDTQATPTTDITQYIINALSDTDHPLFKRLSSFMDAVAEQAMDHHLECYDHDNYDVMESKLDDLPDFDDFVKTDYLEDAVREAVSNLTFDISVS